MMLVMIVTMTSDYWSN